MKFRLILLCVISKIDRVTYRLFFSRFHQLVNIDSLSTTKKEQANRPFLPARNWSCLTWISFEGTVFPQGRCGLFHLSRRNQETAIVIWSDMPCCGHVIHLQYWEKWVDEECGSGRRSDEPLGPLYLGMWRAENICWFVSPKKKSLCFSGGHQEKNYFIIVRLVQKTEQHKKNIKKKPPALLRVKQIYKRILRNRLIYIEHLANTFFS